MRAALTFLSVMAVGGGLAAVVGCLADGFGPGFWTGVAYMLVASMVVNGLARAGR